MQNEEIDLETRLQQIKEIVDGTKELTEKEQIHINATVATVFNLHIQKRKKVGKIASNKN